MPIRLTRGKAQVGLLSIMGGTATGADGAATLHRSTGIVTTESVSTAAGASYTLTLTNNHITADDVVIASVSTAGTGTPVITKTTPGAGTVVIVVQNIHAETAFNAALTISFVVIKLS